MCPKATHFLVREKGSESARQSSAVELGEAGEPAHLPGLQIAADLAAETRRRRARVRWTATLCAKQGVSLSGAAGAERRPSIPRLDAPKGPSFRNAPG